MPLAKVQRVYDEFVRKLARAQSLFRRAGILLEPAGVSHRALPRADLHAIVEMSFLLMFVSWESFLEESFVRFLYGARTMTGYGPKCFVVPRSIDHAFDIVSQGRPYVAWTDPDEVVKRAKLYFKDGEPYATVLAAVRADLVDMHHIRNAIAHKSDASWEKFTGVVRKRIGYVPRSISPGSLLRTPKPKNSLSFYEHFTSVLIIAAQQIAQ